MKHITSLVDSAFYDAVVNDRALIERAYACGMDY